jgi:hypothetical protein
MRVRRWLQQGTLLFVVALLSAAAHADDGAKAAPAAKVDLAVAPSSHEAAARAAADAAHFGLVSVLEQSIGPERPPPAWLPDRVAGPGAATMPASIWAESISDAAGSLGLSSTGSGSDERVPAAHHEAIATVGRGAGIEDLDAFDHASSRVARAHVARAVAPPRTDGRTPPDLIQRIVRESFGHLDVCYEAGLRRQPGLTGRVAVKFVIDRRGAVALATDAGSDLPDADVIACVVRAFDSLVFPESKDSAVTVVYPIVFTPTTGGGPEGA